MRSVFLVVICVAAFGQTFEVATIRPAAQLTPESVMAGKVNVGMRVDAARVTIGYLTLRDLVALAYEVKPLQVQVPDSLTAQRFDVVGTLPEGATKEQVPAMLRALLEERFKLKARREKKEQNVYSLEVAKGGHKMKDAPPEAPPPAEPPKADIVVGAGDRQIRMNRAPGGGAMVMSGGRAGTTRMSMGPNQMMHMEMERVSMADLAQTLTPMLDRPVVDHTGLTGAFQIALDLSMQDMMQAARAVGMGRPGLAPAAPVNPQGLAASDPSGGSIFASVQQLGLRLERTKSEIENVVVDSAEKEPTEN